MQDPGARLKEMLLASGSDIDDRDHNGRTRLRRAVEWPDLPIVQFLIGQGVGVKEKDGDGRQPLHHAAYRYQAGAIPTSFESRPLIMQALLDARADLDAQDNFGDTPLSLANDSGRASSVRFLLKTGANPSSHGDHGCSTPPFILHFLRNANEEDATQAFLASRAKTDSADEWGHTLLDRAAWLGLPAAVLALLKDGANPNIPGRHGNCALHFAAELMQRTDGTRAIGELISRGANLDVKNDHGITPILFSAMCGSASAVRCLLDAGANSRIACSSGVTPVHLAYTMTGQEQGVEVVTRLIKALDPHIRGRECEIAFRFAAFRGSPSAMQLIYSLGVLPPALPLQMPNSAIRLVAELMRDEENPDVLEILFRRKIVDAHAASRYGLSLLEFAVKIQSHSLVKLIMQEGGKVGIPL